MPLRVSLFDEDHTCGNANRQQLFAGGLGFGSSLERNDMDLLRDDSKLQNSRTLQGTESPGLGFGFNPSLELSPEDMRSSFFSRAVEPADSILSGKSVPAQMLASSSTVEPQLFSDSRIARNPLFASPLAAEVPLFSDSRAVMTQALTSPLGVESPLFSDSRAIFSPMQNSRQADQRIAAKETMRQELQTTNRMESSKDEVEDRSLETATGATKKSADVTAETSSKAAAQSLPGPWDALSLPRMIQFEAEACAAWRCAAWCEQKPGTETSKEAKVNAEINAKCKGTDFYSRLRAKAARLAAE